VKALAEQRSAHRSTIQRIAKNRALVQDRKLGAASRRVNTIVSTRAITAVVERMAAPANSDLRHDENNRFLR